MLWLKASAKCPERKRKRQWADTLTVRPVVQDRQTGRGGGRESTGGLLFADGADVGDVGEEVVVLRLGHGVAELRRVLEHADQDLQAVEVGVLRGDHLEDGLGERTTERT